MSATVANQQTNDTTKKTPVKRVSLKQRKDQILAKKEELNAKKANLDFTDAEGFTALMNEMKEIQKEEKILATQEKKARESFQANASLYPHNGIYDNENELVMGSIITYENACKMGFII